MIEKQPLASKKRGKIPGSSIFMYVMAIVIAASGIAYLVNSILYFNTTIANYVAQGYPYAMVATELIPGQLLPGIFQPLGILGIAVVLFGAALINQKLSGHLNSAAHCETEAVAAIIPVIPAVNAGEYTEEKDAPVVASEEISVEDTDACACTHAETADNASDNAAVLASDAPAGSTEKETEK